MLIHVHLGHPDSIRKVAVAWIDSDALSTTAHLEPYLDMLQMAVRFYQVYLPSNQMGESFAGLIEAMDKHAFDALLESIPPQIAEGDPMVFDDFDGVTSVELAKRAGLVG
jgi:hypothetical protein